MRKILALFGICGFLAPLLMGGFSAQAQELLPILEKGQTLVTLSANDQKEVDQDELIASLRLEIEDKESRAVQDKINKAMRTAVDLAKKNKDVSVVTGQYYVYSYDPNPNPKNLSIEQRKKGMIWKGSQELNLKSKDSQAILDLVGDIQDQGFVMNGLTYGLSTDLEEAQKDSLLEGALKKIQAKAALISKALGKSGFDLVEVNVDGSYMPSPMPMMHSMAKMEMSMGAASDSMAAPVAEPGKTTVSMSVSARIILKP